MIPTQAMHVESALDGGFVALEDILGSDLTVVNAARVSYDKRKEQLDAADVRLISYLAENQHFTPFAQPQIRFHIKMPLFIARQWFKHTVGLTRNEISRRYVSTTPTLHIPAELRLAAYNVKQGSSSQAHPDSWLFREQIEEIYATLLRQYENLIAAGVCAEQARMILPQSMYTEFIETGSLAAYARIYYLRAESHAQKEIQEYAAAIARCIQPQFPVSWKALCDE